MINLLKLATLFAFSLIAGAASAQVTLSVPAPPYGWLVENGSVRHVVGYVSGGATNKVNWSVTGPASLDCTSSCPAEVGVTITGNGCTPTVSGSVGSYSLSCSTDVVLTMTSVDDATKHAAVTLHVIDTTSAAFVDVEPSYNQAYRGQKKMLQSYVPGYKNQNVTWAITTQPSGGNGALTDTVNRDTLFSATVTGRYVITATSVANGTKNGSAIIYVSPNTLPRVVTLNQTEPTECWVDPALTGGVYEIGPTQAIHTMQAAPFLTAAPGSIFRIHNEDTTGLSPTTYHEAIQVVATGTATQPIRICGVADSLGNLPVMDGINATENAANGPNTVGAGAIKLIFGSLHFGDGYNLGSAGPDYVGITGIRIQHYNDNYKFYPAGSTTLTNYNNSAGIWGRSGQHILFEGMDIFDTSQGILMNNNTSATGRDFSQFHQLIGSRISNFSFHDQYGYHGAYMEALHSLIEGSLIQNPNQPDNGDFVKMRGGDSIIRYNLFRGTLTDHVIEYPDMEDTAPFMAADSNLGTPGTATCSYSVWCTVASNNITLAQLTINAEALTHDFAYGNIFNNTGGSTSQTITQYGSFSAPQECAVIAQPGPPAAYPCTNMIDRNGAYYFFSNTVNQPSTNYGTFSTANYNGCGGYCAGVQFAQPSIFAANNVIWSDPNFAAVLNLDATMIGTFQTNMFQSGSISITTPIAGGANGWGGYTNSYSFTMASPLNTHLSGLSAPNFLSSSGIPFNRFTFAPNSGSPLISAGSAITNTEISAMPVRYQYDAVNGYVTPRTNTLTIGAVDSGATPTIGSLVTAPASTSMSIGNNYFFTSLLTGTNGLGEDETNRSLWTSSNPGSCVSYGTYNLWCGAIANGSGHMIATAAGTTSTGGNFTVGTAPPIVVDPTCTPAPGVYGGTQSVTCSSTTPSSTTYCTINGTAPTSGSPVCTSISVSTSLVLKAISEAAGATNSNVVNKNYTIGAPAVISSILIAPATSTILTTGTQLYNCTATLSDGTYPSCASVGTVSWTSSNNLFATINSSGMATGVASGTTTIQAAVTGATPSTASLTLAAAVVADPIPSPGGGTFASTQSISVADATAGSVICYRNDGVAPTASAGVCGSGSTTYSVAISVPSSLTLKLIASKSGSTNSNVVTAAYIIGVVPPAVMKIQGVVHTGVFH